MKRVREEFFYRVNPFNSKQISGFSLKPEDVDAICFWTKNPKPLMGHLNELTQRGLNYYFQFTLNTYGKEFEPKVPPLSERVSLFNEIAGLIGSERVVWRYDPVILTNTTPVDWHLEQINQLADQIAHSTRRLIFSFYDFYGKGQGRLHAALQRTNIVLEDITAAQKSGDLVSLAEGFSETANRHNIRLLSCSEGLDLSSMGIDHGACIDGNLIQKLFGGKPSTSRDKNQRQACGCVESVDMGMYNTCHFGCTYCYANFNNGMIEKNRSKHHLGSPSLLDKHEGQIEIQTTLIKKKCGGGQLDLF